MNRANRLRDRFVGAVTLVTLSWLASSCTGDYRDIQLGGAGHWAYSCSADLAQIRETPQILVTERMPASAEQVLPSQVLLSEDEFTKFKVSEPGLSLSVISSIVYGTSKRWPEIAHWNNLAHPYRIRLGQVLIVKSVQ